MGKKLAAAILLMAMPMAAFSSTKEKGNLEFKVISSKTKVHNSPANNIFSYTSVIFAQADGMNLVLECVQKGDLCPLMEAGKTYMAEQDGDSVYVPMSFPDDKRPLRVKYRRAGTW